MAFWFPCSAWESMLHCADTVSVLRHAGPHGSKENLDLTAGQFLCQPVIPPDKISQRPGGVSRTWIRRHVTTYAGWPYRLFSPYIMIDTVIRQGITDKLLPGQLAVKPDQCRPEGFYLLQQDGGACAVVGSLQLFCTGRRPLDQVRETDTGIMKQALDG